MNHTRCFMRILFIPWSHNSPVNLICISLSLTVDCKHGHTAKKVIHQNLLAQSCGCFQKAIYVIMIMNLIMIMILKEVTVIMTMIKRAISILESFIDGGPLANWGTNMNLIEMPSLATWPTSTKRPCWHHTLPRGAVWHTQKSKHHDNKWPHYWLQEGEVDKIMLQLGLFKGSGQWACFRNGRGGCRLWSFRGAEES